MVLQGFNTGIVLAYLHFTFPPLPKKKKKICTGIPEDPLCYYGYKALPQVMKMWKLHA